MYLNEKIIKEVILNAGSLYEAIEGLYRLVFPDWEEIEKIEGWPKVGLPINNLIFSLLGEKFGRDAMMIWANSGFGTLYEDSGRVSLEEVKIKYYPRCPWCGRRHPAEDQPKCAPDYGLEAAYEERFEMDY